MRTQHVVSPLPQFNALRSYISSGGCVLLLMSEGGEKECNINFLLEEFGILLNNGGCGQGRAKAIDI